MRFYQLTLIPLLLVSLALGGCSKDANDSTAADPAASTAETPNASGLTAAQLENGIGPIEAFAVGPIDQAMAERGEELFRVKCTACHKLDERYIGPPLSGVTEKRTPAYVMNMIMNPEEMTQKHPVARALLAEYVAPMANQSLTRDEARAILEYLRTAAEDGGGNGSNADNQ